MRVKAMRTGLYNDKRVREGVEFDVAETEFSHDWMMPLDEEGKKLVGYTPPTISEKQRLLNKIAELESQLTAEVKPKGKKEAVI